MYKRCSKITSTVLIKNNKLLPLVHVATSTTGSLNIICNINSLHLSQAITGLGQILSETSLSRNTWYNHPLYNI